MKDTDFHIKFEEIDLEMDKIKSEHSDEFIMDVTTVPNIKNRS